MWKPLSRRRQRAQQPRGRKGGAKRRKEKIREKFGETRVDFTKCITTKIVIWLLNSLGLCLNYVLGGGSLEYLPPGTK